MTHDDAVKISTEWLARRCNIAIPEQKSIYNREIPDVIGFNHKFSVLIECKVSRSDFLSDNNKKFKGGESCGSFRIYACPKGLIKPEEVPDNWGLIYLYPSGRCVIKKRTFPNSKYIGSFERHMYDRDMQSEMSILISHFSFSKEQ